MDFGGFDGYMIYVNVYPHSISQFTESKSMISKDLKLGPFQLDLLEKP